jgi:DNA-binding NtrC family response regulator
MARPQNILIVDDEIRLTESLSILLKAKNYTVCTANSGQEGLALVAENRFDLAILDVHLNDMLGTELMAVIKERAPDTVIVLITGDANLDSALAALKCGAYDYLKKPFEIEALLHTVENALTQRALEREKDTINEQLSLVGKKIPPSGAKQSGHHLYFGCYRLFHVFE